MNKYALFAASLAALTTVVHIFAGGPEINAPIQASDLDPYLRAISAVLWHAVSVTLVFLTAGLLWSARTPNRTLEVFLSLSQIGFASLFLFFGITLLGEVKSMPQWVIFLLIPAITALGWRGQK